MRIELVNPDGELTTEVIISINESGERHEYRRPARYYHLVVANTSRWPVANNVQIMITRLEAPDPGGRSQTVWLGELPLQWQHAQVHALLRTVGRPALADSISVVQDPVRQHNELHLMTLLTPNNFGKSYYGPTQLWVTVIARANEADSRQLRLEIAWDGQWSDGGAEMRQHLVIRPDG